MSALSDIQHGDIRKALGNCVTSRPVLAINAGGAATVKTTNAITYTIDGRHYNLAALSAQSINITHDAWGGAVSSSAFAEYLIPAGKTVYLLLSVNAAGTVAVSQGTYSGQSIAHGTDLSKVLTGDGSIPKEPDGYTAFGLIKIVTANAATFNPGTTALDATDVTATYYDLTRVPATAP